MENMFILYHGPKLIGIYSTYQKAVHAMMMNFTEPIYGFHRNMGVDFFTDGSDMDWAIKEQEVDKI